MRPSTPAPSLPAPALVSKNGDQLDRELTDLVDEIQRTRDWFNAQIEAQLNSLHQLRAVMQGDAPEAGNSMASLFEAPPPPVKTITVEPMPPAPVTPGPLPRRTHEAIVLPPTHITAIDPGLEQATLRELNDALSRAFSEISTRGGMLG